MVAAQTTAPAASNSSYQPPPMMDAGAVLPYGGGLFSRPEIPEDPAAVAQQASCVFQIDGAPGSAAPSFPANPYTVTQYVPAPDSHFAAAVLTSTAAIDDAAGALQITPEQRQSQVRVHATAIGGQLCRLEVDLEKGPAVFADGVAEHLVEKLRDQVSEAFAQSARARNKSLQSQTAQNEKDLLSLQTQLTDARSKLEADSQQTSTVGTIYGDVNNSLANARQQRQTTSAALEQSRARLSALEPSSATTLVTEWEGLVGQYEQRLGELNRSGTATDAQLKDAQARLTDAQAHLAMVKEQSENSNDVNRGYRNQESASLKATIAEEEARLKEYDNTIAKLTNPSYLKALDEQRSLQMLEQSLVTRIAELQSWIAQTPLAVDNPAPVTLTVLDGKPEKPRP